MDERQSSRNVTENPMTPEEQVQFLQQRIRELEDNERSFDRQFRMRAIELVMGTFGIPKDEMDNEFRGRISRAEAISNFILNGNGSYVKFNEATEEGHMAANFVQAMNWLDEQGISRADESGKYSIIHRIKLLLATANRTFVAKEERSISEANVNTPSPRPYKYVFKISGHHGNVPIERTIYADALIPAVVHFRALHPLATIEYIDDIEVMGLDEETLHPIFEGDEYTIDPEAGSYTLVKSAPWPAGKEE